MTKERTQEIEFIRSDLIGPAITRFAPKEHRPEEDKVEFDQNMAFQYPVSLSGPGTPVFWRQTNQALWQEIIHFKGETPLNKYGAGLLYAGGLRNDSETRSESPAESNNETPSEVISNVVNEEIQKGFEPNINNEPDNEVAGHSPEEDFEVTSRDAYKPSTMGVSFCLKNSNGKIIISFPDTKHFFWQGDNDEPFQVNGGYQKCVKNISENGKLTSYPAWRRIPVTSKETCVEIDVSSLNHGKKHTIEIPVLPPSTLKIRAEIFPRKINKQWLITVVLRNFVEAANLDSNEKLIANTLFQSFFEVSVHENSFEKYPEGTRPFEQFDSDEQTLALLYRDTATWAIGHGCAAGWDAKLGETPKSIYADVLPATELPSMTPDIKDKENNDISLSMLELAQLPSYDPTNKGWKSLEDLHSFYAEWIVEKRAEIEKVDPRYTNIANSHIDSCRQCEVRIKKGIDILKTDEDALLAFKLANKSMLLQQIASKNLKKRSLRWTGSFVEPESAEEGFLNPEEVLREGSFKNVGNWRAFQIAFLLMSLEGVTKETDTDNRDLVDLIWFPTGGGKTEAYLSVAAFYMFHQRLMMPKDNGQLARDGTNVFMRYTLRMLTTQQFQRAASLICAMEFIRSNQYETKLGRTRFSLGLWIGGEGSPNSCEKANAKLKQYKRGELAGNPLVLTECPWCKCEIGVLDRKPDGIKEKEWQQISASGFSYENRKEPVLTCSDGDCHFNQEDTATLPIEVIDERIYRIQPSMFIGTVDKFAMLAYKPEAGALFGRELIKGGPSEQVKMPPGLIIQDEFHLISGPLGTMYGAYESIFEQLCTAVSADGKKLKPKIIASTATIRGAQHQVKSIFARDKMQLFPSPGLLMKDSFFGRYATEKDSEKLSSGRLYLGVHAHGYGSFLTTQVRLFTAVLFRSWFFDDSKKDPWWTLLAFYNSIRELGGARTLFSSDIAARLKNYFYRYIGENGRYLNPDKVEELTSRKSQAELVLMMDRLAIEWDKKSSLDACLSSNIIEVGVDIDRLSLMAVVGQPKSTAQYIQVTGRVGRKWWERPGLILAMYNPSKSRDRSHFEQFHSYHRRLYEQVEPTSATPFSIEAIERAAIGVMLLWARQCYGAESPDGQVSNYSKYLLQAKNLLVERCQNILTDNTDIQRSIKAIDKVYDRLLRKWHSNPTKWQKYPQKMDDEYLMLWPGQVATRAQKLKGEVIPSSMRSVDGSANLQITPYYYIDENMEGFKNGQ
ncbi:helicase-related protein [Alteromonas macleodii]|uniref:helicase-related protein n=1 Tax=Alteromonas macleodii TaxID=28108 RepID=UPI00313E571F